MAIDGPVGSGKSTVARGVAAALGLEVLDTGAMYRADRRSLALERGARPRRRRRDRTRGRGSADLELGDRPGACALDGRDVSRRDPWAPTVIGRRVRRCRRTRPCARCCVPGSGRGPTQHGGGVVEGRDIGTVVFPDAPVKVFLTADEDERARRRQRDEDAAARPADLESVRDAVDRRDTLDSTGRRRRCRVAGRGA